MYMNLNPIVLPEKQYFEPALDLNSQKLFYTEGENAKMPSLDLVYCVTALSISTIAYPLFALIGLIYTVRDSIKCVSASYKRYQVFLLVEKVNFIIRGDLTKASKKDLQAIQSYATERTTFCLKELKNVNSFRENLIASLLKESSALKKELEEDANFKNTEALLGRISTMSLDIETLTNELDKLQEAKAMEIAKKYGREIPTTADRQRAGMDLRVTNKEFKEKLDKRKLLQYERKVLRNLTLFEIGIKAYTKQLKIFEKFDINTDLKDLKNVLDLDFAKLSLSFLESRWKVTNFAKLMVPGLGFIWATREFPALSSTQAGEPQGSWGKPGTPPFFAMAHNICMEEDKNKGILVPYLASILREKNN